MASIDENDREATSSTCSGYQNIPREYREQVRNHEQVILVVA